MDSRNELAEQFEDIFERLLAREKIDSYEEDLSFLFEAIASDLIECPLTFDGVTGLISKIRKSRQVIFEGKMWTVKDGSGWEESLEPFGAIVTDKRITKQGIWIKIWVGDHIGEGNLSEIWGSVEQSEQEGKN